MKRGSKSANEKFIDAIDDANGGILNKINNQMKKIE